MRNRKTAIPTAAEIEDAENEVIIAEERLEELKSTWLLEGVN